LHLSNGSTIDISNFEAKKPKVKLDPVTGNFTVSGSGKVSDISTSLDRKKGLSVEFTYQTTDYREQFENKREALHDMVADGDGFTKEEIHDLVKTANLLVWQESKNGGD